jgi:hypothetical protein
MMMSSKKASSGSNKGAHKEDEKDERRRQKCASAESPRAELVHSWRIPSIKRRDERERESVST